MSKKTVHIRKSVYDLSAREISNLREAFNILYENRIYQEKAGILISDGHYMRNDMLFLPWARAYFADFEKALQAAVPDAKPVITLPYWDYTSKRAIKKGIPSLLSDPYYETTETDENGSKKITKNSNPFYMAEYDIPLRTFRNDEPNNKLLKLARGLARKAMKAADFVIFGTKIYLTDVQNHIYLGGSSANTNCTAYDPIFWFTHCQLDRFWDQWQKQPERKDLGKSSMPDSVLKASLNPFNKGKNGNKALKTEDVLNTENLGYMYVD
jgi:tyrosinase